MSEIIHICPACATSAGAPYALTRCTGDPDDSASWSRHIVPQCLRCQAFILMAKDKGIREKRTGHRWYAGHGTGKPPSKERP